MSPERIVLPIPGMRSLHHRDFPVTALFLRFYHFGKQAVSLEPYYEQGQPSLFRFHINHLEFLHLAFRSYRIIQSSVGLITD